MIQVCFFADEVSKDFEEAVKLGVEAGATAVEIRGGLWGKSVTNVDDGGVKRMQDVLAKYGAKVTCIGSPVGKCRHDSPEEVDTHRRHFDRMIELAHTFGTRVIRGFSFWKPKKIQGRPDLNEYLDAIVEGLTPIVCAAEAADVTLSFETEGSTLIGTCQEARTVIDALGNSPALSVCWDVLNSLRCGEHPYPEGYAHIEGLVTHMHVKPNREKHMNPVGDAELTYQDIFKVLQADGFDASASIEHWGSPELMLQGVRELHAALEEMPS